MSSPATDPADESPDTLQTLAVALDKQTRRADAMAMKYHERGDRIAGLEITLAELNRTLAAHKAALGEIRRDMAKIMNLAAQHASEAGGQY